MVDLRESAYEYVLFLAQEEGSTTETQKHSVSLRCVRYLQGVWGRLAYRGGIPCIVYDWHKDLGLNIQLPLPKLNQ